MPCALFKELQEMHGSFSRCYTQRSLQDAEALREVISVQKSNICRGPNVLDVFALQINDEETLFV